MRINEHDGSRHHGRDGDYDIVVDNGYGGRGIGLSRAEAYDLCYRLLKFLHETED